MRERNPVQDQLSQDLASLKIDRSPAARRGRRSKTWIVVLVIIALVAGIGYFVVYPRLHNALFTKSVQTGTIALVSPQQGSVQLTATGYVQAEISAKVAAKVPGRIAELFVEEGQTIEKGDKVARLEDVDQKSAIAAARARAQAARARTQTARAAVNEIKVQFEREKWMFDKGVSAKAVVEDLAARIASLQATVRAAEAEAAATDAEVSSLETQLGSFIITTPISGIVVDKLVEVGEGVSPGFGTPGVVEVVDPASLIIEVDVPENKLSQVKKDKPAEIVLDAYPDERLRGTVKEIGNRVNRAKATVPVKISFVDRPKDNAKLLPEMAGRVAILDQALSDTQVQQAAKLVVPTTAVVSRDGRDVVFIVDDGEVRMTAVRVGGGYGSGRELVTAIPAGTKVVLDPPVELKDGEKVKEKN